MVGWLFEVLADDPGADAIVTDAGRCTRGQLRDAAERLAGELTGRRPTPDLLLVRTDRPEVTALAAIGGGLAGIPVRHDDPQRLSDQRPGDQRPSGHGGLVVGDTPRAGSTALPFAGLDVHVGPAGCGPDPAGLPPAAQIFSTSGSTGAPVGVVRSAPSVRSDGGRIAAALHGAGARPVLMCTPAFHAYGFSHLVSSLIAGAVLRCCAPRSRPSTLFAAAAEIRAGVLIALPFQYRLIVDAREVRLPDLAVAVSSAAPLAPDVARRAVERHRLPLVNAYGSSEAGTISFGAISSSAGTHGSPPDHVGVPLPGIRARVGPDGELWLSTDALATGYLDGAGLRPLPLVDGWYRSGDRAELVDGAIRLLGRAGDLLNIAGKKVSRTWIEHTLARHPQVTEAQVVAEADPLRGELPVARVVIDGELTIEQLVRWSRGRLAPHEMPRRFEIRSELSRSATGKPVHDG